MENASKALIIAAAVIIAISVVALGAFFLGKIDLTQPNARLDQAEVLNHNNKFYKYQGEGITGAQVKDCISLAMANNRNVESVNFTVSVVCDGVEYVAANTNPVGVNVSTISNLSVYTGNIVTRPNGAISQMIFN